MSGVYSVEDLLKLRASPLICKPPNLPPIEEWMGTQEPAKRPNTRGRQEEGSLQPEGFQKRPTLDPSQRKSTTDPERLVLGPPRRSFASSSGRPFGKPGPDPEEAQKDRPHHERNKTGDDLDTRFSNNRISGTNGRFGARHEQDGAFQRRRHEEDEVENKPRREHDRPRWGARDGKDERGVEDNLNENSATKPHTKREQGRSKFEQPWLRSERGGDESRRDHDRGNGYRRDRTKDGDWDMPGRNDVDPEWMESIEAAEPAQARTQEDFQRWKERMKAGTDAVEAKTDSQPELTTENTEVRSVLAAPLPSLISPDVSANSMDKWFARLSEKKVTDDKTPTAKPVAKTRFASLFGPQPQSDAKVESTPAIPAIPQTSLPKSSTPEPTVVQPMGDVDPDQAGFQRILQMLGKRETTSAQGMDTQKSKTPHFPPPQQIHQRKDSPDLMSLFKQDIPTKQTPISHGSVPPGFEVFADPRPAPEGLIRQMNTPNKDELLLNLLRQAEITAKPRPQQQQHHHEQRGPPGLAGMFDATRTGSRPQAPDIDRPQMQQRETGRSIFDDQAISGMSYQDELRAREGGSRRPTNGGNNAFDDPYLDSLRSDRQQQKQTPAQQQLGPQMQRPPGLDQMSRIPPGWDQRQAPQTRQGLPPGLARGPPPGYGGGHQPPMPQLPQQIPGQGPQRTPQRKYTGESSLPGFPPGMGPLPGFMSGGPPPGFHHGSAAGAAQNFGRYGMGGNEQLPSQQQQPPQPNMNRGFLDIFRNDERGGLRGPNGGVPLPPGFR